MAAVTADADRPDVEIAFYDPARDGYDLAKDPRCLWGCGGCSHRFGHRDGTADLQEATDIIRAAGWVVGLDGDWDSVDTGEMIWVRPARDDADTVDWSGWDEVHPGG